MRRCSGLRVLTCSLTRLRGMHAVLIKINWVRRYPYAWHPSSSPNG
eukprot:XP_001707250.1 Hypothetical protein GL50803_36759 [Giardia lamblia ATCC 50803]